MKGVFVGLVAACCLVYLANPTLGWIELIPDNLPLVGNLDEVTVSAILLACLRYFGVDWTRFLGRKGVGEMQGRGKLPGPGPEGGDRA